MGYYDFGPYVSVAEKRRRAERELAKLKKKHGRAFSPVAVEGRDIAKSFWGKSWCLNLEGYSDYDSRLPRGRAYVRNGSVVHLEIAKGAVSAMVAGSELYQVRVTIAPVDAARWKAICRDCAGSVDSLVEILQGRLAEGVMDRVCREGDGLFPSPKDIELSCSCPDWAEMCKHVAAVLYGIGARLDSQPELLFVLCDVDVNELLAGTGTDLTLVQTAPSADKLLDAGDVAALFGLEMAEAPPAEASAPALAKPPPRAKTSKVGKPPAKTKPSAAKPRRRTETKPERKPRPKAGAIKKRAARRPRQPV
jgi:uncharacterized Zn finger protein